jgi:hypothetical protein
MAKKARRVAQAQTVQNLQNSWIGHAERYVQSWWSGWKTHLEDVAELTSKVLQGGYAPSELASDLTGIAMRAPGAALGFAAIAPSGVSFYIDESSEAGDRVITVPLPSDAAGTAVPSDLIGPSGTKITKDHLDTFVDDETLTVRLVNLKGVVAGSGIQYKGTIDVGATKKIPVTVSVG